MCIQSGSQTYTALLRAFAAQAGIDSSDITVMSLNSSCPSLSRQATQYWYLCKITSVRALAC